MSLLLYTDAKQTEAPEAPQKGRLPTDPEGQEDGPRKEVSAMVYVQGRTPLAPTILDENMTHSKPKHKLADPSQIKCLHPSKRVVFFKDDDLSQPVYSCNSCGLVLAKREKQE